MAMLRLNLKRFNAGRQGAPTADHARYLLRQMPTTAHVQYALRTGGQAQQRDDLVASGAGHLPAWAQGDAMTYWDAAQTYSRKGGVVAKELEISLPRELTHAENLQLIHDWLARLPAYPTTWAFHEPRARNGVDAQPHVHILMSPRPDDLQHPDPQVYFKQPNHGGVPAVRLWTQKADVRHLWKDWEQLLRSTLKAHGFEHTLERWHTVPEIALTWEEMKQLERLMRRTAPHYWGHEYRIPATTITTWQQQGTITLRQATWLAQRGQRQLTWKLTQEQQKVWSHTTTLDTVRPWQLLAKHRAQQGRQRVEATMHTLQEQRHQLSQVYMTSLNPARKQEVARYRQDHGRVLTRGRRQGQEREGARVPVALPTLDAALRERTRHQEMER